MNCWTGFFPGFASENKSEKEEGEVTDKMDEKAFVQTMLTMTGERGIPFSSEQALICYRHITLMLEWNRSTNLTRITDFNEILIKHLLDSMIPAQWLPKSGLILDIGTGPGFPGIPLKILHPGLDLVLLESSRKKISFLKVLLAGLNLKNVSVLPGRLEEFGRIDHPLATKTYDAAVMRAVHLERGYLKILARHILRPEGIFAWWAGPSARSEQQHGDDCRVEEEMVFMNEHSYSLPSASQPRRLMLWRNNAL